MGTCDRRRKRRSFFSFFLYLLLLLFFSGVLEARWLPNTYTHAHTLSLFLLGSQFPSGLASSHSLVELGVPFFSFTFWDCFLSFFALSWSVFLSVATGVGQSAGPLCAPPFQSRLCVNVCVCFLYYFVHCYETTTFFSRLTVCLISSSSL